MKKIYQVLLLSAVVMLFMASCGKDGATGPAGQNGANGSVGPAGPAGANGSIIYSGTTTPPAATGATGDYYLDLATGQLYGPKTSTGWGTPISLKGSAGTAGATGAAGSQIYSGSGAPPSATGVTGDYYLDKSNYQLYGPKSGTDWGTPLALGGNADLRSDVIQLGGADWLWSAKYRFIINAGLGVQTLTRYYVYNSSYLTSAVLDNGLVLVYFQPDPLFNPDEWVPLPYSMPAPVGYNFNYVYVTSPGTVTLEYFFSITDATNNTVPDLSTYTDLERLYKIVIIDGQGFSVLKNNHINLNDYKAVSRATGLWQSDKLK